MGKGNKISSSINQKNWQLTIFVGKLKKANNILACITLFTGHIQRYLVLSSS